MKKLIPSILICFLALTAGGAQASRSFTGAWNTNWGRLEMTRRGEKVMGHYTGRFSGIIDGTVSGARLSFAWSQPNGEHGRGYFDLSGDGAVIDGEWGMNESDSDGGSWSGTRAD